MPVEITEEDICGYDEGGIETGETIIYESKGKIHDKIKEMRDVKTHNNNNKNSYLNDDTRDTLQRIEQELLHLKVEDKSSEEYHRVHSLYQRISSAYEKKDDSLVSVEPGKDIKQDDNESNFSFDFHNIQRLTKLEQKIYLLEKAVGFDIEENKSSNIISRINKLYSHLKLIKNELNELDGNESHEINIGRQDSSSMDNDKMIKSYEQIKKYSPYMDHIITRLETYSSLYDGMIENNLRLQQWDEKMDVIIRQQDRWIKLLDQIDGKLTN